MHERKSDHIFGAATSSDHEGPPRVDATAGDEGIDDPDVSEDNSPAITTDGNATRPLSD